MKLLLKSYLAGILLFAAVVHSSAQRQTINLNGTWQFERTEKAFPPKKFSRNIPVPGLIHLAEPKIDDYNIWFKQDVDTVTKQAHGVYDIDYVPMYSWYRKEIELKNEDKGKQVLFRIKKSQYVTQVYVNGIDIGTSMECYTPIEFPITRALKFGQKNEILLKVGDRYWLPPQAAGSTDKEKEHYLPGIWDDVELILSGDILVNNTLFLPKAVEGKVTAKVRLRSYLPQQIMYGDPKEDEVVLRVELFEKKSGKKVAEANTAVQARRENFTVAELELEIENAVLWTPDEPFIYSAKTSVLKDEIAIDVQEDQFGMRDFERRGKYFYLNGKKILLRGTNITLQRFFEDPDCSNLAWDREWVKKLIIDDPKQVHWNAMRICVGIVPDFWYDLADEFGMMFQNEWNYWQTHGWDEQVKAEYTNWVWSDGNHPSIIIWDAINENWDPYIGNVLIPELKKLDPTRTWDAGYMTATDMGNDEMDEPHPYEGFRPWSVLETFEKNPYPLGDLDYRNATNINSIESSAAQLVNEYGWIWLWRDGRTAKLTNRIYNYYLGDASDPVINRNFQAYWLQCETEWLRSIRQHAGVLAFTHLTNNYGYTGDWYINAIKDLEPGPTLAWFRHSFAPTAVFINLPDERYMKQFEPHAPGSQLLFTLKAINDFAISEEGRVNILLYDSSGKLVWSQEQEVQINPYGEKNYPVVLDLPDEEGGYTLHTEFRGKRNGMEKQVSRRYVNVGVRGNKFWEIEP
ncbi:glycoside hydrolase family 2 protein [Bacteroidota bacterium]